MPRSLDASLKAFRAKCARVELLATDAQRLDVKMQPLAGELAILYLAIGLEQTLFEVFCKICCGVQYLDGTNPILLQTCKSAADAEHNIKTLGRTRRQQPFYPKWLNSNNIVTNIQFLIDPADGIYNVLNVHFSTLERIRWIRNHVAHRSRSTTNNYRNLVRQTYGPNAKAIAPGGYLLSERKVKPAPIFALTIAARVLVREIVRAPP